MKQTELDRSILHKLYGHSSTDIINILSEFIFHHPQIRKSFAASLGNSDLNELGKLLHYHAPAFTYSGFPALTASCRRLKELCEKEENYDTIQKYLTDLLDQLDHGRKLASDEIAQLVIRPYQKFQNLA